MRIDIVTLFPKMFQGPLNESILARARRKGLLEINLVDLRHYADDQRGTVDDTPCGGGAGMLLKAEPVFAAIEDLSSPQSQVILLTPQGEKFTQPMAGQLARVAHLIMVCGHYEGIDERARQTLLDREISIGDFILTSGNLAAMVVCDAISRLLPGVLGNEASASTDSFGRNRQLEYPQYTKPAEFRQLRVPPVLLAGNHAETSRWRERQSLVRTVARRPDLI